MLSINATTNYGVSQIKQNANLNQNQNQNLGKVSNKMSEETDSVEINKDLSFKGKTVSPKIKKSNAKKLSLAVVALLALLASACQKEKIETIDINNVPDIQTSEPITLPDSVLYDNSGING